MRRIKKVKKPKVYIPMITNCIGSRPIMYFKDENEGIIKHNSWLKWLKENKL